ncbi:MAG: ABC transporter permease [Candidatus Thiodiazotropha sp.]
MLHIRSIIGFLWIALIWWILSVTFGSDSGYNVNPIEVALELVQWIHNSFLLDVFITLFRVYIGVTIGILLGVPVGLITGRNKMFDFHVGSALNLLRSVTPVALAPFFVIWFGVNETAKLLLIAWGSFFPIWLATHIGVRHINQTHLNAAVMLGFKRIRTIISVEFPSALPFTVSGIRTSIAIGFILVFISETLGASSGVGFRLSQAYDLFDVERMAASLVVLGILGVISDQLFIIFVKKVFPWLPSNMLMIKNI